MKFLLRSALGVVGIFLVGSCARAKYVAAEGSGATVESEERLHCDAPWSDTGLCLSIKWISRPTEKAFGSFRFKIWRPNALDGSTVLQESPWPDIKVILWMPAMGHGSAPPVIVSHVDVGTYSANRVFFSMAGLWELHFQIGVGAQTKDAAVVPFTF